MSVFHKSSAWVYYPNLIIQREPEAGEAKKLALSWVTQLLIPTAKSMMTYLTAFQHPLHITLYSPCSPASLSPTFLSGPQHPTFYPLTSPSPTPLYTINSSPSLSHILPSPDPPALAASVFPLPYSLAMPELFVKTELLWGQGACLVVFYSLSIRCSAWYGGWLVSIWWINPWRCELVGGGLRGSLWPCSYVFPSTGTPDR